MPPPDLRIDIYTPANLLIEQHGVAGAAAFARERIGDLLEQDKVGADRWHMILDAIWELSRTSLAPGEDVH